MVKDPDLLKLISKFPCVVCSDRNPKAALARMQEIEQALDVNFLERISDPDHVTTRGAGGGDIHGNVMPLCRAHHTERHTRGIFWMIDTYAGYRNWLETAERRDVLDHYRKNAKKFI